MHPSRGDEGFSLTEMVVVLLVVSIIMAISGLVLVMLERSSSNVIHSVQALQQEETASNAITPFLHSANAVTAAGPSSFTVTALAGINDYNTGPGTYGDPLQSTLKVTLATCSVTSDPCDGQTTGYQFIAALTNSSSVTTTIVASDSQAPATSNPYSFDYYDADGTQLGVSSGDNGTVPSTTCALEQISRIDITVQFLSGSQAGGNAGNQITTWETTIYLQNVTATTSTTSTTAACAT